MFDFFTSDTHFGHRAIIDMCHRPFNDTDEMTEGLIDNFNSVVGANDRVLWVGDVSFVNKTKTKAVFDRLRGKHWLVRGNHDSKAPWFMDVGFELVTSRMTFSMENFVFLVSHYPYKRNTNLRDVTERPHLLDRFPNKGGEDFLLHGHTHSLCKTDGRMIHVGVDAWDMFPASREQILELARKI